MYEPGTGALLTPTLSCREATCSSTCRTLGVLLCVLSDAKCVLFLLWSLMVSNLLAMCMLQHRQKALSSEARCWSAFDVSQIRNCLPLASFSFFHCAGKCTARQQGVFSSRLASVHRAEPLIVNCVCDWGSLPQLTQAPSQLTH